MGYNICVLYEWVTLSEESRFESRFTKHVVILDKLRTSDAHLLLAYALSSAAYSRNVGTRVYGWFATLIHSHLDFLFYFSDRILEQNFRF